MPLKLHHLLPALLAVPLAGCVNLGPKLPERLLSLTPTATVADGTIRSGATRRSLIVGIPQTPRMLETSRIPVQMDEISVAYVKDGQWVDQPGRLFQRLLSEIIAARTDRVILDPEQFGGEPGMRLAGELLRFGIDARTRQAIVTYDATVLGPDGSTVMKRRFAVSRPVGEIDANSAGNALNAAANEVAAQVAEWIAQGTPQLG